MRILGIDPGSRYTGYGIINVTINKSFNIAYEDSGCITLVNYDCLAEKLKALYQSISQLITEYQPQILAIESVFVGKNAQSALKLGQARGVAMVCAANHGIHDIAEYAPRQIKQALVGKGSAEKSQVEFMVKQLLNIPFKLNSDGADALACAICHANHLNTLQYFK